MKKFLISAASFTILALPAIAFAQTNTFNGGYIQGLLTTIKGWLPIIIGILFSIAFIVFLFGVLRYVIAGSAEAKEGARKVMIYGIIGLAVMALAWGIVYLLGNIFGVSGSQTVTVPTINY